jgi:protein TonB
LKRVDPEYPKIAKEAGAAGRVELVVTIAPEGNTTAVKVVAGHPMLQNAAVQAVKQWTYSVQPLESAVAVTVNFPGDDAL